MGIPVWKTPVHVSFLASLTLAASDSEGLRPLARSQLAQRALRRPLLRTGGAADRGWWFQGLQGQQSPRLCVVGCFFRLQALQEGALPPWGAFQSRDCGVYVHARGIDPLNVMGASQRCGVAPTSAWISGPLIPADETMLRA